MNLAPTFAIGYHFFYPDVSINYQLNGFCDGTAIHRGRVRPGQQAPADSRGRADHPGSLSDPTLQEIPDSEAGLRGERRYGVSL